MAEADEVASKAGEGIGMTQGEDLAGHVVRVVETEIVEEVRSLLSSHSFSLS